MRSSPDTGMSNDDQVRYVPTNPAATWTEPAKRLPFELSTLSVSGLVIICELDDPPPGRNARPSMHMKMTQYLRLSDESMIRLDMDRGLSSFKHGYVRPVSWKQTSAELVAEVLTLIQGDEPDPGSFPWEEYAQAARLRGIPVEAESLRDLPHTVLISDELATIFEF